MSVRDGLLAILTIGPAYGHQLHAELRLRAAHRGPVNVGQIYTTIERLTRQKLVEQRDRTDDGLPLYRLTPAGLATATTWMTLPVGVPSPDWTEMLDQLLITSTIDVSSARSLAARFEEEWDHEIREAASAGSMAAATRQSRTATDARRAFATAAVEWVRSFVDGLDDTMACGFAESRPLRGRRPSSRSTDDAAFAASS